MKTSSLTDIHQLVWTALMAALIGAGAYINIPIGPVPISLQTFFVTLAGFVLGPRRGALAVALYLLAGVIGLPVFAGGKSGLGHMIGPTGGFLFGFLLSAFISGLARGEEKLIPWFKGMAFGLIGMVVVFAFGAGWLKFALDLTWSKVWAVGVAPFIIGGVIKTMAALATCRYLARFNLLPNGA
ncbi:MULTISPECIES: biotin transporter BioY [unclassified Pseudodesulfovibrio]|uniref:biotin transporter BioY n=1 Tax=unclassified Pseudodesulfovibrio TaxID=2661612 RepID=UPI000FEB61C6|nr:MULTISPECIES: biotin transporter BioY [unclassified Pseudodesulfovibrio]MCJ2166139.1 biotin transporter BioY [Pseudodesulfovibrio sp. S3-i]RWU02372.1 biotin transporter BioY [Pseudodesulfovibrio sp. S3]